MIVKGCHIDGFGNLHDTAFDFSDGLNVLTEDNGWGKSTLAAFIKSMFYGMEISRKRKLTEYKRYEPWQGGRYGGSMVFEAGGRTYRVVRYFGKKDAVFELYDNVTNMPSSDFSERLGEELFGIDRESFERSIFIKLDTEQKDPALSDSISAKLNNLVDNTDDINNFETAYKRLDALAVSIVPKRGSGGEVGRTDERLSAINGELLRCDSAEREAERLRADAELAGEKRQGAENRLAELRRQAAAAALYEKKRSYDRLAEKEAEQRAHLEEAERFFAAGLPPEEDIEANIRLARQSELYEARMAELPDAEDRRAELAGEERFFERGLPSEEETESCRESILEYNAARERLLRCELTEEEKLLLEEAHERYGGLPDAEDAEECAAAYAKSVSLAESINARREELRETEEKERAARAGRRAVFSTILPAAAVICGCLCALMRGNIPLAAAAVILAAAAVTGLVISLRGTDQKEDPELAALIAERERLTELCKSIIRRIAPHEDAEHPAEAIEHIRADMAEIRAAQRKSDRYEEEKRVSKAEEYLRDAEEFLDRYTEPGGDLSRRLSLVQSRLARRNRLHDEIRAYDSARAAYDAAARRLDEFLKPYDAAGETYFERVQTVKDAAAGLAAARSGYEDAKAAADEFRSENDMAAVEKAEKPELTANEAYAAEQDLRAELEALASKQARAQRDIEELNDIADRRSELEGEKAALAARREYLVRRHGILTDTAKLLAQARNDIDARYMKDMVPAFNKYITMIEPGQDKIALTAELGSRIINGGKQWESGYHSRGYADMTNICTRLALYDVMYKGEKPFIIMDDPFVNMDDDKTRLALEFLKKLAEDRQIFYFTCHSSRSVG